MVVIKFDDKIFYLFGDVHTNNTEKCPSSNVPYFGSEILNHLSKLDKIVDFFYEQAHEKIPTKTLSSFRDMTLSGIIGIQYLAINCVYYNETIYDICPYKNIRFHQENVPRDKRFNSRNSFRF